MIIFNKLHRYGNQVNSHDLIKCLAISLMIVDHVGAYILDNEYWYRVVGRAAAPLFFFLVGYVESFRFKSSLLVYGLILTGVSYILQDITQLNILLSFVLIKLLLDRFNPHKVNDGLLIFYFFISLSLSLLPTYVEYGAFGLMFAIGARLLAQQDKRSIVWLAATLVNYFLIEQALFDFQIFQQLIFSLIVVGLFAMMMIYHFRYWSMPALIQIPILFLSRYSLTIYFYHLLVCKLLFLYFSLH